MENTELRVTELVNILQRKIKFTLTLFDDLKHALYKFKILGQFPVPPMRREKNSPPFLYIGAAY